MASSLLIGTSLQVQRTIPRKREGTTEQAVTRRSPINTSRDASWLNAASNRISYTKAENVYATYLVERQAKEKQAALNKTENKTTDVFLVERKAEAKQNSAENTAPPAS